MRSEIERIEGYIDLAREMGNVELEAQYHDDLYQIQSYLNPLLDHRARPRAVSDNQKRMVDRVSRNIRIEVESRTKPLDQGDGTGLRRRSSKARLADHTGGEHPLDFGGNRGCKE